MTALQALRIVEAQTEHPWMGDANAVRVLLLKVARDVLRAKPQ